MNKRIFNITSCAVLGAVLGLTSCNKEPDDSNLYTFTGQTIEDYLTANDSLFHNFSLILKRSGYDRMLDTYGEYTCYAPTNDAVNRYVDSLYNDPLALVEHNGLTSNSVEALTDSMCKNIAMYHIANQKYSYLEDFSTAYETPYPTMLNESFLASAKSDGKVYFNNTAAITQFDLEMTNGYVQVLNNVIPRETRSIYDVLQKRDEFSVFFEGLSKCGLKDTLSITNRPGTYTCSDIHGRPGSNMYSGNYYVPSECKVKYTIFAENNETLAKAGITDFASLKQHCIDWYKDAAQWYSNPDHAAISTGDDYTNKYNVVNMFFRYHILGAGMPVSKLLYDRQSNASNVNWNYAFGGEPYDYYETLLPHALMKIWQPLYHQDGGNQYNIWINRWRANNTMTDQVGTFGSDAMHPLESKGVLVSRASGKSNISAANGYIHTINDVLLYDSKVNNGVLHERLRFDTSTMFYELINNDIRFASEKEIIGRNTNGTSGTMVRLPLNYFQNFRSYNSKTQLAFYLQGPWRAWEADQISGWGEYDFAFRLPPVPTGDYEIRIIYPPMGDGGFMQYYIGTSSEPSTMTPLGIPFDARYPNNTLKADRQAVGYLLAPGTDGVDEEDMFTDYGVASDLIMRNHGYMRAPASFSRGTNNNVLTPVSDPEELLTTISNCCRYEQGYGTSMMRKILGTYHFDQSQEYWLRLKNMLMGYDNLGFSIDFIELVPVGNLNNASYTEDWY